MTKRTQNLTTATTLRYALIAFPLAAGVLALQIFVPTFYAESTGLSLASIAGLLFITRMFDMVTDPLVGTLSDHTPARFGRRKGWILAGLPLLLLSLYLLFHPPEGVGSLYLLLVTAFVYLAGTMVIVPYYTWGAELAPDYHDRSKITGARVVIGLLGTLAALTVPALMGTGDTDLGPVLSVIFILVLGTAIVALLFIAGLSDAPRARQNSASLWKALKLFRRRTPLRQLLAAYLMNGTANGVPATLLILYVTHVLNDRALAGPLIFLYFAVSACSVPFWVWLSGRTSKSFAWQASLILAIVTFVWTPFLGAGDGTLFMVITLITGIAAGADLSMPVAMQGDLVDWDAATRGKARPGIFFALWGTMTKLGFALAIGVTFSVLDLVGFDATTTTNTAQSKLWLSALYAGLPVLLKTGALLLMRDYPVTRTRHDRIRVRLAERGIAL